jgi:tRNA(fMet)-specific endonuclease VapC
VIEYLLDTNIVIYTMRDRPPEIRTRFTRNYGLMAISTVTLMELYYGSENSDDPRENRSIIEGFVARLELLQYDEEAAFHTGLVRKELKTLGQPIGAYDGMIAGHARPGGWSW